MRFFDAIGSRFNGRGDLSGQYRRYRETLLWVVTELFRFDRNKTLLAISFNVMGGLLKGGALALLLYYANLMESSSPVNLLGFSWDSRSETVFIVAILVALVLLVCGALAVYFGSHINNVLAIAFAAHCSRTVLCASGGRPERNPNPGREKCHPVVKNSVTSIIGLVRGVKPVLNVSSPLSTLLYSVIVLFYLNGFVTLTVLVLAFASLLFQYKVNYQAVQNVNALLESKQAGNKWLDRLFDDLVQTPKIYQSRVAWIERSYRDSALDDFLQRYYQRVIARPRSALVGDLLLAILLFLLVAYLGSRALAGEIGWTHFLAYLLFARISLLAFRGLLVSITGFARHYPRVRRISEFSASLVRPAGRDVKSWVIAARGKDKIGDRKRVTINPGDQVCILTEVPLTRFNVFAFVDAIAGRDVEANNRLCAETACISRGLSSMPGGSLNELMAFPDAASAEDAADYCKSVGMENVPELGNRDELLSDEDWRSLSRQDRACLLLEQAREKTARLVLVDAFLLAKCGSTYYEQWRKAMSGKLTGIVSADVHELSEFGCNFAVLMAPDRSVSVAAASWCLDNAAVIKAWFGRHSVQVEAVLDDEVLEDE